MIALDFFLVSAVGSSFQDGGGFGKGRCADGTGGTLEGVDLESVIFPVFGVQALPEEFLSFFCTCGEFGQQGMLKGFILLTVIQAAGNVDACLG